MNRNDSQRQPLAATGAATVGGARRPPAPFDLVVVTAANAAQARGYRAQLRGRGNFVVVPDPGGRRVGSLGATVNVLRRLSKSAEGGRKPSRVLICHSGGDARRTPGYAAMGKAFVPMRDARPLLDHIVEAMERLPARRGVTVCCGDVIPYLDFGAVEFAASGVTGVAYPDGSWQARRHGVYVAARQTPDGSRQHSTALANPDGSRQQSTALASPDGSRQQSTALDQNGLALVADFLQKPQVTRGRHLIDTGILFFDWATAAKMTALPIAGDIYEEFPKLLLGGFAPFHVSVVPRCDFFHIGSTRELLAKLGARTAPDCNRRRPKVSTAIDGNRRPSKISRPDLNGPGRLMLIDAVDAPIARLGGDNVVTNVPRAYGPICLERGECLTSLPLGRAGWYHLKYNIDDNFKADGLWEQHGLGEKMKKVSHSRLIALRHATTAAVGRRVTAPVRIDFAGGWSDTPPICYEEGGAVLAAAVTLDGKRPIEVTVTPRRDRFVKVVSKDLGKRRLIRSAAEIADHHDPHDWCCLVKAALAVTGFRFGEQGLDITISANLPKGSGMGTSSILGAATIAALIGEVDVDRVGALTLRLEQEMRTGGGWEDQFAGMTPGVKMMRSKPGRSQSIAVEGVRLPARIDRELKARSLLYFTGQKRMARNVLRRVLGFYADNPHNFGKILIDSVKKGAERAAKALRRGDLEAFAACVNDYWRDKKLLDAGSTNEHVDDIIDAIRPDVSAVSLAGAGGGGFMYILAKSPAAARKVRTFLERNPPTREARFYDFGLDSRGMTIDFLV